MPRLTHAVLLPPLLALAACGSAAGATTAAHAHSAHTSTEQVPATARMICSDDIKAKVQQALRLDAPPTTHDMWADAIYTCHYSLPMGPMTLSDQVFPDPGKARAHMATATAADGAARPVAGLGQQAYATDRGVVVLKDNQLLTVDASGLPERFGVDDQRRADLAYEVASDVLGCWTGDE